jgi:hypothetical protein
LLWIIPTMIPKIPRAEAKISTIKILTKRLGSWASAIAHEEPAIPTLTPEAIFEIVTSLFGFLNLIGQDNGHNDTVNSRCFTENNTEGK